MLNNDKLQFQKEQDELLTTILNLRYFDGWRKGDCDDPISIASDSNLEIFITDVCNQNCEYCYLVKYEGLYPKTIDKSPEHLLHNLRIVYNYILENNLKIPKIEFFSGEIWHTKFGLDVLDLTLEYIKNGMQIGWVMTASNFSFCKSDKTMQEIQRRVNQFKNIGCQLSFSASVDGKIIEDISRPFNSKEDKTDEFYDRVFAFCKHNNFGLHPMIAASTIDKWPENYAWWQEKLKEYNMPFDSLMMLEVRNANWTDEAIKQYCDFINMVMMDALAHCDNDIELFTQNLFCLMRPHENRLALGYIPYGMPKTDSFIGCTCATDLTLRLGDLALAPCHRTSYNKYLYGYLTLDENQEKIVGISANNPQVAMKILLSNFNLASFGCDTCLYNNFCLKGCYGSQLETLGDPFIPIPNICKFFKAKYSFLLTRYKELGIIDYLRGITPAEPDYLIIKPFLDFVERWEKENGMGKN